MRRTLILFLAALLLTQSGCLVAAAGAAAGAGAYAYYRGNVTDTYAVEFGEAYQASREALADMAMPVISENHQGVTGSIESSLADGTRVSISVEEKPRNLATDNHSSQVGVRIGTFGDQNLSARMQQQIATRISQRNRTGPAPAKPASATRPADRLPPLGPQDQTVKQASNPGAPAAGSEWKPPQPQGQPPTLPP